MFAATISVHHCLAQFYDQDLDEDIDSFGAILCPNDRCSQSEDVEIFGTSQYHGQMRLGCCKLSGLHDWHTPLTLPERDGYGNRKKTGVLIIEESKIENIPEHLTTSYHPTILRVIFSGLKTLKINDFAEAIELIELNVTHNKIDHLEPNIFIYAHNLEVIDLSNNRITDVSEYSFENIPKLKILILSNNLIEKFEFKSSLIDLQVFMIDNNSLTHLNDNILERSAQLTDLRINDNKLNISKLNVTVRLDTFDMSNNPTAIYLISKNLKIKNSNVRLLNIDKTAVTIDASKNRIDSIVVDPRNALIDLNLSRNNYTTMRNLTGLKSIEKLDLSFNQIEDFNLTSFSNMPQLKELNLENSGLKIIDFGLFSQQQHLNWLDISYNDLKEVNFNMLTVSIAYLYIEGNALTNIDLSDIAITLPYLRVLGLSNNKFSCEKLIEIRKLLASLSIEMYVDELLMVKFSRNINGIGCVNENSTETMEFSSTKVLPIHTDRSKDHQFETLEVKINEIEKNIRQHSNSMVKNSINSKDDIVSMKRELMNIRNDGDLKIVDAKADILMSVSSLLNLSTNGTDVSADLKSTIFEVNKINLERYQSFSSQLKLVNDKLQDLVQSVTELKSAENYDAKNVLHLKQNRITDDRSSSTTDGSSDALMPLKNMMTFIIVAVICLILGFSVILFYKRFYREKRRYLSTNTVNTNVEQSLV